jgi:hypothetical protein
MIAADALPFSTVLAVMTTACAFAGEPSPAPAAADPRDDGSPWALATGAEWSGDHPRFNPLLREAGITWLRYHFAEWGSLQPRPDVWRWEQPDSFLADARRNGLHPLQCFAYFAPWVSADGGTRKGPVKDIRFWKEYVGATVRRYKADIKYWEVWNEFNGSFYIGTNKVQDYADLALAAYDAAKAADPGAQVGLSVAGSDIGFLDLAIKAGAADHFDFICLHPYENLDAMLYGDVAGFLGLAGTVRQMLAANRQPVETPIWFTEGGATSTVQPDAAADAHQAEALLKFYLASLAQGVARIFWFEARGPDYGGGRDFGLIRKDWTLRPSYAAMKTMTTLLGATPRYAGWLQVGGDGYGFVFEGAQGPVLAAWAPLGAKREVSFETPVRVVDAAGAESPLAAGRKLTLGDMPIFVLDLPPPLLRETRANIGRPFPWGGDFSRADAVFCRLAATNSDHGLRQILLRPDHERRSEPAVAEGEPCRRVIGVDKDRVCAYFRANPEFAPFGPRALEVTVVARRDADGRPAELALTYETREGYRDFQKGGERWTIPAGDGWQKHTWRIEDACFANRWGWHIGLVVPGADNRTFLLKEVRVAKMK